MVTKCIVFILFSYLSSSYSLHCALLGSDLKPSHLTRQAPGPTPPCGPLPAQAPPMSLLCVQSSQRVVEAAGKGSGGTSVSVTFTPMCPGPARAAQTRDSPDHTRPAPGCVSQASMTGNKACREKGLFSSQLWWFSSHAPGHITEVGRRAKQPLSWPRRERGRCGFPTVPFKAPTWAHSQGPASSPQ